MSWYNKTFRIVNGAEIRGTWLNAFIHNGDDFFLTEIKIYQDGLIDCWGLDTLEAFKQKLDSGWVTTELPEGAKINISMFASFRAAETRNYVKKEEFLKEVMDQLADLNGRPTSREICLEAYKLFQEIKTEEARAKLRQAYEAVPEHNRRFVLGDMDMKDIPIRMIIYGEDEIEHWSHRIVSKQMGLSPLPTIKVEGAIKKSDENKDGGKPS